MINWARNLFNQQIDPDPAENTSYFIFDLSLPFEQCYHGPQYVKNTQKIALPVYIRTTTFDQEIAYTWLLTNNQQQFLRNTANEKGPSSLLSSFIDAVRANNMKEAQSTLINFVSTDDWFYHAYYGYLEKEITLSQLISIQIWAAAVTQFGKDNFILTKIHNFFRLNYETRSSFLNKREYKKTNYNDWAEDLIAYSSDVCRNYRLTEAIDRYPPHSMILINKIVHFVSASTLLQAAMITASLGPTKWEHAPSYHLSTNPSLPHEIFPGFQSLNKRPSLAVLPEKALKSVAQVENNDQEIEYTAHHLNWGPWGYMQHEYTHAAQLVDPNNIYLANLIANVYACIIQLHEDLSISKNEQGDISRYIKGCIDLPVFSNMLLLETINYTLNTLHKPVLLLTSDNHTEELSRIGFSSQIIYYSDKKQFYITCKSQSGDEFKILPLLDVGRISAFNFINERFENLSRMLKGISYDDLMKNNYLLSEVHSIAFMGTRDAWEDQKPVRNYIIHAQILLYCHLKSTQADAAQWDRIAEESRSIPTLAEMEKLPAIKHYHESPGKYNYLYSKTSLSCKNAIIETTQHEVSHDKRSLHKF